MTRLAEFEVDPVHGFLAVPDPLRELPAEFAVWETAASELPRRIPSGRLRGLLASLPLLDADALHIGSELRRAMLLLSYLGHAYVWCEDPPARELPAPLAVPWARVAERLGRPPVLSYASYALDNWRRLETDAPLELGRFCLLQNFLGGVDEDWFIGVHIDIEAKAAPILCRIGPILDAAHKRDARAVARHLEEVAADLERICAVLGRMPEYCDPYVYYRRVRPYIHGWANHPALPEGLVYQGVERFGGHPQRFRGETGAQSGIVPCLDALLGIAHAADPLRAYLLEMRGYMPPPHRAFLEAIEAESGLRTFVVERAGDCPDVATAYEECVQWLAAFRTTHLHYAARYIHRQSQARDANPTHVGTGGTPFMSYLRKHRDETVVER